MPAVRTQIMDALKSALEGLAGVGLVVPPGMRDPAVIGAQLAQGDYVVEMGVGEDEVSEIDVGTRVNKSFDIVLLVHIPDTVADASSSYEAAGDIYGSIVALYNGSGSADGTWESLAIKTDDLGGGAVGYDAELGTLVTYVVARVTYRHTRGDLTEAR